MKEHDSHMDPGQAEVRGGAGSPELRTRRSRAALLARTARRLERSVRGPWGVSVLLLAGAASVAGAGTWLQDQKAADDVESATALPGQLELSAEDLVGAELPMEYNERVGRWIERYLTDERVTFEKYLARESLYGPLIRAELRRREMPEALIYLAMIESGFSPWADSRVAASGVWQFMGPTARAYGLRVDRYVDERRDPVRATEAALDYLEELNEEFGSWYLAAAAYNAGPGRVSQALSVLGDHSMADDAELYWEIIGYLPRETQEYVPKILAAAILGEEADHFGFDVEPEAPYLFDRVLVPGGTGLTRIAEAAGTETELVQNLNPHLVQGVTPPGEPTLVRVPQGASGDVVASLASGFN